MDELLKTQIAEELNERNIRVRRPGTGLSPVHFFDLLGTSAARTFKPNEQMNLKNPFLSKIN